MRRCIWFILGYCPGGGVQDWAGSANVNLFVKREGRILILHTHRVFLYQSNISRKPLWLTLCEAVSDPHWGDRRHPNLHVTFSVRKTVSLKFFGFCSHFKLYFRPSQDWSPGGPCSVAVQTAWFMPCLTPGDFHDIAKRGELLTNQDFTNFGGLTSEWS